MGRNALKPAQLVRRVKPGERLHSLAEEYMELGSNIPNTFWHKVREIAAKTPHTAEPSRLLVDLFKAASKHSHAAYIGNLLLEKQVRLPVKQEAIFIMALARQGRAPEALKLWHTRQTQPVEAEFWRNLGIQLNCIIGRLATAESLALETQDVSPKSLYALAEAYSTAGGPRLDFWISKLAASGSEKDLNRIARLLLRRRRASALTPVLAKIDDKLSGHTVTSILAATKDRSAAAVALATRPDVSSKPHFIKSWMKSLSPALVPELASLFPASSVAQTELIDVLLKQKKLDAALQVYGNMEQNGPEPTVSTVQSFILYAVANKDERLLERMMKALKELRFKNDQSYSRSIQPILRYLAHKRRFNSLFLMLKTLDMQRLHHSNYVAIWKTLLFCAKTDRSALQSTSEFDAQSFFLRMVTASNFRMDPVVFELAARTFLRIGDLGTAAFAIRYMAETGNLPIDPGFVCRILKAPDAEGMDTWEAVVGKMCMQYGASFDEVCADTKAIAPAAF